MTRLSVDNPVYFLFVSFRLFGVFSGSLSSTLSSPSVFSVSSVVLFLCSFDRRGGSGFGDVQRGVGGDGRGGQFDAVFGLVYRNVAGVQGFARVGVPPRIAVLARLQARDEDFTACAFLRRGFGVFGRRFVDVAAMVDPRDGEILADAGGTA